MSGVSCKQASHVAQCITDEGHVLLIPMSRVAPGDDLTDHQVILVDALYIRVWNLLGQFCSVTDVKNHLPANVKHEALEQVLEDLVERGLAELGSRSKKTV